MYVLLSSYLPFDGENDNEIFSNARKGECNLTDGPWEDISVEAKDLISKMLTVRPKNRPTIVQVLNHPWFTVQNLPESTDLLASAQTLEAIQKLAYARAPKRLKAEATKVLMQHITHDNFVKLNKIFNRLDTERTGTVNARSLLKVLETAGLEEAGAAIKAAIQSSPYLEYGSINYTDFIVQMLSLKDQLTDEMISETFNHFDTQHKGYITQTDISTALMRAGTTVGSSMDIAQMFKECKSRVPGRLSYNEFEEMIRGEEESPEVRTRAKTFGPIDFPKM